MVSSDPPYMGDPYFGVDNILQPNCIPYLARARHANQTIYLDRQSYEPFNLVKIMNSYHKGIFNGEHSFVSVLNT